MRDLGTLEATIMNRMWSSSDPQTVRAIHDSIAMERDIAYTTVMTVMDNLFHKGFLNRERTGRAYLYSTRASREEHTASILGEVLADGGDRTGVLMQFVEQLNENEIAALRKAVTGTDSAKSTGRL